MNIKKIFFKFKVLRIVKDTVFLVPSALLLGMLIGAIISIFLLYPDSLNASLALIRESSFQRAFFRTLRISLAVAAISSILAYPSAIYIYSISSKNIRRVALSVVWLPVMVNPVIRAYGWMLILGRYGVLNSLLKLLGFSEQKLLYTEVAVIAGLVELFTPFLISSIYSSLNNINEELILAAKSLGASGLKVFKDIILPLSAQGYIFGLTIVLAGCFTAYTTPVLLGGTKNITLSMLLYMYASTLLDWKSALGLSILMLIIVMLVSSLPRIISRRS